MGDALVLTASDGHRLDAYRAQPTIARRGGVVVVQEIFGVNGHIRDVCDRFAALGYEAIAPALFDRIRKVVELAYDEDGIAEGRELATAIGWDHPTRDIEAAATAIDRRGKTAVVGYCWGASWAWVAACRLDVACVVSYYGRHIVEFLDEKPRCPALMHFGADDASIPPEAVEKIRAAYPDVPIHLYAGAGHGFNCDRRADFRPNASAEALEKTLALLARHLK